MTDATQSRSPPDSVEAALSKAIEPALDERPDVIYAPPPMRHAAAAEAEPRAASEPQPEPAPPDPEPRPAAAAAAQPRPVMAPHFETRAGPAAAPRPPPPPIPQARERPRQVSPVFEHLVEGDDDVIGLIAYALYKQDKRTWIVSWKQTHGGAEPTDDQVEAFVKAQMTAAQRERYRAAGRQTIDAYSMVAVDYERPMITQQAVAGRVELAAARLEASRRWWRQIPAVLIGGLAAAAILLGLVAVLVAAGVDVAGYLGFARGGAADGLP
jgi:hypothetical protein